MKTITNHLSQIILAVSAIALIVGVLLAFSTPIGAFFEGITDKLYDEGTGSIWDLGNYGGGSDGSGNEEESLEPGLYKTDSNYTELITPWDELLAQGVVHVENGVVYSNFDSDEWENSSSDILAGDLVLPNDGSIAAIGDGYQDDNWNMYGNFGFMECAELTSIEIPNSVTSICDNAFNNCVSLKSIKFSNSLVSIGDYAFQWCENLTTVDFGTNNSLKTIGKSAFGGSAITSIALPASLETIDERAFDYCEALENVTLAANSQLVSIGEYAFSDCTSLSTFAPDGSSVAFNLPDALTTIGKGAFQSCGFKSVIAPNISVIPESCFRGCDLESLYIPENVETISKSAFNGCTYLENITFEDGAPLTIGYYAFSSCTSLKSVTIPSRVISFGNSVFSSCTALESVTFAGDCQLTNTGDSTFFKCTSLKSITIPSGITMIYSETFRNCSSLESVTISDSVTIIGTQSFDGCTQLSSIIYEGTVQQWNLIDFRASWNKNVPATYVQCSDGQVAL